MTATSIVDIPLDTTEFDAFRAKYDAFRARLAETPQEWARVAEYNAETASGFGQLVVKLDSARQALAQIAGDAKGMGEDQANALDRWTHIAASGKVFASNVKASSLSIAKWAGLTGLFSSILAGGGLYGIGRMAVGVASRRSSAMSYGLSYGEMQSYETHFARLGNARGMLSGFNEAMTSADARYPLYSLMGPDADRRLAGKTAAGALAEALPDIKRLVDRTDPKQLQDVIRARGLDRLGIDLNTAMTIRALPMEEINQIGGGFRNDVGPMGLPPDLAMKWQEFSTALDAAGSEIENHFAQNLANLAPGLTRLADALSNLFDHMLKDGGPAAKWLERANTGLVHLGDKVGSPGFATGVENFMRSVGAAGRVVAQIIEAHKPGANPDAALNGTVPTDASQRKANRWINWLFGLNRPAEGGGAVPRASGSAGAHGLTGLRAAQSNRATTQSADQSTLAPNSAVSPEAASNAVATAMGKLGENEFQHRADIAEYLRTGGHGMDPARAAWCAAFVGSSLEQAGIPSIPASRGGNIATSYLNWGQPVAAGDVRKGDVLVESRGRQAGQTGGHVGLATGEIDGAGRIQMISGNSSSRVRTTWEDPRRITARRANFQGQTDRVDVEDHSGEAYVSTSQRSVGPMSYSGNFGRFGH